MGSHDPFGHLQHKLWYKKKGQESKLQFDSRPQKVRNQPDFHACRWHATCRWKALNESCNFASNLIPIGVLSTKLQPHKVAKVPTDAILRLPFGSPETKKPFECGPHREVHSILYGGRWWLPPSPGRSESCESEVAHGLSQHQRCSNIVLSNLWLVGCRFM